MPIDKNSVVSTSYNILMSVLLSAGLIVSFFSVALVLVYGCSVYYDLLEHFQPRMTFDSLWSVLALFIVGAYLSTLLPLKIFKFVMGRPTRRAVSVRWKRIRKTALKTAVLACSAALLTIWLWADTVDGLFAVLFVLLAHAYRKRFLKPRHIHGWMLVFFTVGYVFLVNCDKLVEGGHILFLFEWVYWTLLAFYLIHLGFKERYRHWKWIVAALLIWLLPIVELPGEITRQFVGWSLTGKIENLYFTKIRPDRVYALELFPRNTWVTVFKRQSGLSYEYEEKEMMMDGGVVSGWSQTPRSPPLFVKLRVMLEKNGKH